MRKKVGSIKTAIALMMSVALLVSGPGMTALASEPGSVDEVDDLDSEEVSMDTQAAQVAVIDLYGVSNNISGDKYSWDNENRILTLEDGFSITVTDAQQLEYAMRLQDKTTIVLNGRATITTDYTGIFTPGTLTVKSAEGVNGFLDIKINRTSKNNNIKKFYGIVVENLEGKDDISVNVTDGAALRIDGGYRALYCHDGTYNASSAVFSVTNSSVAKLANGTQIGEGFTSQSPQRIIWVKNSENPVLQQEAVQTNLSFKSQVIMMSFGIEGAADNNKEVYTLTYDGEEHPLTVHKDEDGVLDELGIPSINIEPVNFTYDETTCSEYLNNNSDFRDKVLVPTETQYHAYTAASEHQAKEAATYRIKYGEDLIVSQVIAQRKVVIEGLQVLDKTYDGWPDAQIDYSNMTIRCVNDGEDTTGIVAADAEEFGEEIVPWASAFFLTDKSGGDYVDAAGKEYKKSADVGYTDAETMIDRVVISKKVYIEEIRLSDPNYDVVDPSNVTGEGSQIESEATIYPRALSSDTVSCILTPTSVKWKEGGYIEDEDFSKSVTDTSPVTPLHPELVYTLEQDKDYLVNPNTKAVTEVGEYEIILSGQNNYTGIYRLGWEMERAERKVEITMGTKTYDGNPLAALPAGEDVILAYTVTDVDNNVDLTENLEAGSNLKITYSGTKADGTVVEETLEAPKDAGTYTVTVSVDETTRYLAASDSLDYTIDPKMVEVDWTCTDASVAETETNPSELVYNATPNVFCATVTNAAEGDEVLVEEVKYKGLATDGQNISLSTDAPWKAGSYTVCATKLSNANYTVGNSVNHGTGTPWHTYTVTPAKVYLTWEKDGAEFTYDTTDHTIEPEVHGICSNAEGTEDICRVDKWEFTGTDAFGNAYTQTGGAVNASPSPVTMKAIHLSNANYVLTDEQGSLTATFTINPMDITDLKAGTSAEDGEIWAERLEYTGSNQEPVIVWSKDGLGETLEKNVDYTASSSTVALEYNKNGLVITVTGKGNYTGKNNISWNVDKITSSITITGITNYTADNNGTLTTTYGDDGYAVPVFTYAYENKDIKRNYETTLESYLTLHYTGTLKTGQEYDSDSAPTQAGSYTATVTMAETDHYWESTDSIDFEILPRNIRCSGGVTAVDKDYDGTKTAALDFSASEWTGFLEQDAAAAAEVLKADPSIDAGPLSYTADFEEKNVKWETNGSTGYTAVVDQTVKINDLAVRYTDPSVGILANYALAQDQPQLTDTAKITPKKVTVSGLAAKDKAYDGNDEAAINTTDMVVTGVASGEKLTITITGTFQKTGEEGEGRDVNMVAGAPAQKNVSITYGKVKAGNQATNVDNYELDEDESQSSSQAVISQATLTIRGVRTVDKVYDGTASATLDWTNATVSGSRDGELGIDTSAMPATVSYNDASVAYTRSGDYRDKSGTIPSEGLVLTGTDTENYDIDEITFEGLFLPRELSDIVWTYDDTGLSGAPTAAFGENSGLLDGDECDPVVEYFSADDEHFAYALETSVLDDDLYYVAKVTDTSNSNYRVADEAPNQTYEFRFDNEKNEVTLTFTNYQRTDDLPFTVTYGDSLPVPVLEDDNADLADATKTEKAKYLTISYKGTTRSGETYESTEMPTQAGTYKVYAALAETNHFKAATARETFVIEPKEVRILDGIKAAEKYYNGTNNAVLTFAKASFDGFTSDDEAKAVELFTNEDKDYIRYTAAYSQTHVAYEETLSGDSKYSEQTVTDVPVTVSGLSFILTDDTPALLYNYVIAESGNQTEAYGRILPRPVTVSGIKASNKYYDGTSTAKLNLSSVKISGKLKNDALTVVATGKYTVSGNEKKAYNVLKDSDGKTLSKKVSVTIVELKAGNKTTQVGDYVLAKNGQQKSTSAKIHPAKLTSVIWSMDETANVPVAALTRTGGIVNSNELKLSNKLVVNYYDKTDTKFKTSLEPFELVKGTIYVARVEKFNNNNYQVTSGLKKSTYTFTFKDTGRIAAENALNKKLSVEWKDKKLNLKWGSVSGADGYYARTSVLYDSYSTKSVSSDVTSCTVSAKNAKNIYRAYVRVYKVLNGRKRVFASSLRVRAAGDKVEGHDAVSISVKKKSIVIKAKKTADVNATVKVLKDGKKVKISNKKAKLRYWSTNTKVATVSSAGKITGKKQGTCKIYVMALNGKKKKVTVTVK